MSVLKRAVLVSCVVLPLAGAGVSLHSRDETRVAPPSIASQVRTLQVPIGFENNRGQVDARVDYLARGPGYSLFLTASEAVFRLLPSAQASQSTVLRLSLIGANKAPVAQGEDKQQGVSHYIHGAQSRTAARFGKVRYTGVYPGIDVVYYGNQRQLEYDFIVAAGADPKRIGLRFGGTHAVKLDASGNLVLSTEGGDVVQHKPIAYQTIDGERHAVDSRYRVLADHSVAFEIGAYDRAHALVIDPVVVYRAPIGGSGADTVYRIVADAAGNTYVSGDTESLDFPVTNNAVQPQRSGVDIDTFVAKINAAGTGFVYSTYLGGSVVEFNTGIALAPDGSVVVTGITGSANFPLVNPVQSAFQGYEDVYVARLSADGSTLLHSTYLGGPELDNGMDVAVDAQGNAYVAGITASTTFPTTPGVAMPTSGPAPRGFVSKFAPNGSLIYSTFMPSRLTSIVVDRHGNAYTGGLESTVRKLSPNGDAVLYTLPIAGSDRIRQIELDDDGYAYVLGRTKSAMPAINSDLTGYTSAYVCKVTPAGTSFVYCANVGESIDGNNILPQSVLGIVVDAEGGVLMTGGYKGNPNLQMDGYLQRLLPSGRRQSPLTSLGAVRANNTTQTGYDVAVDADGNAYIGGNQSNGETSAFVARFTPTDWKVVGTGDMNADGRADLFWHNRGMQQLDWWRMSGATRVAVGSASIPSQFSVVALADFNGDKRTDVLWRDQAKSQVWLWQAEADGSFSIRYIADHPPTGWNIVGAADIDGDGRADILWHNRNLQELDWWLMDGAQLRAVGSQFVPSQYSVAQIADFSGDRRADLVWQDDAHTTLWLWQADVYDFAISYIDAYPPAGWKIVGAGDLDGDHRADLLWHNAQLQQLDWWRMQGATRVGIGSKFIPSMYRVDGVADFDGDGRTDVLWRDDDRTTQWLWRAVPNDFDIQFIGDHPQGQ